VLVFALYSVAVDPDEVLRLFRRVSYRSALTATLATRLVPVLRRDAGRLAEAQRARPGPSPSRFALLRAVSAGALDRAVDVAAALEVRGYGGAGAPARIRRPWSRHDFAFALAAAAIAGGALAARYGGLLSFDAYPRLHAPLRAGGLVVLAAIAICTLAPFGDRRGVRR
jgi:energy-coupling factor transport system permease protein